MSPLRKITGGPPHPHAVWGAALCLMAGLGILIGGPQPNSLDALLPTIFIYCWAVSLTIGGALLLAAFVIRELLLAVLLERAGCILLATATLVYTAAALWTFRSAAAFPASLSGAFGAASVWRVIQITHALHAYRGELRRKAGAQ